MKKIITSAVICLFYLAAYPQTVDTIVFKNATKVILKNNLSASENFKKSGQALIETGYMIGSKDEQFNQIISEPIKVTFGEQVIYIVAKDNEVIITSKLKRESTIQMVSWAKREAVAAPIVYKNESFSIKRFNNMVNLAKKIGEGRLYYSE